MCINKTDGDRPVGLPARIVHRPPLSGDAETFGLVGVLHKGADLPARTEFCTMDAMQENSPSEGPCPKQDNSPSEGPCPKWQTSNPG